MYSSFLILQITKLKLRTVRDLFKVVPQQVRVRAGIQTPASQVWVQCHVTSVSLRKCWIVKLVSRSLDLLTHSLPAHQLSVCFHSVKENSWVFPPWFCLAFRSTSHWVLFLISAFHSLENSIAFFFSLTKWQYTMKLFINPTRLELSRTRPEARGRGERLTPGCKSRMFKFHEPIVKHNHY